MKRFAIITSVVLAVGLAIFLSHSNHAFAAAATVYVDPDNSGVDQPGCGTDTGTDACATINYAISQATDGDTINVQPATYAENVVIGGRSGLTITGDVENSIIEPASGIGIAISDSTGITITNLKIHTTGTGAHGIWVAGTPNSAGPSNNLTVHSTWIIVDGYSSGIYAEQVTGGHSGWLIGGASLGSTIDINDGGDTTGGDGMDLYDVTDSEVSYNDINVIDTTDSTAVIWSADLAAVSGNTFAHNTISGSTGSMVWFGAHFLGDDVGEADGVTIASNTFDTWGSRALRLGVNGGLTNVSVTGNTFSMDADDDIIDDSTDGEVTGGSNTFNVESADSSLAAALDDTYEGDTVNVAPGNYNEGDYYEIDTNGITLNGDIGDEDVGPGEDAPYIENCSSGDDPGVYLNADDVTIRGFIFQRECDYADLRVAGTGDRIHDNRFSESELGVGLTPDASDTKVYNNVFEAHSEGIVIGSSKDNEIYDNNLGTDITYGIQIKCGPGDCDVTGNNIHDNTIHDEDYGVYYEAGNQDGTLTIGPDNEFYYNDSAVYVDGDAAGLVINGNSFHDNPGLSGLDVSENSAVLDASHNWWGCVDGPNVNGDGPGDSYPCEDISTDSPYTFYRPFYTNAGRTTLSTSSSASSDDISDLLGTGAFSVPSTQSFDSVDRVTATETITITIAGTSGSVVIPSGTVITQHDGSPLDASALSAAYVDKATVTGLNGVQGALQWGIPGEHLDFDPAITLHIDVGTSLNGKTLKVQRSVDGVTWTSDGIVAPATCVVTAGICTFDATEASTYASTTSSSGSSGGSYLPGYGPNAAPGLGRLAQYGLHEGDVTGGEGDPDIYIVNAWGYKRLFLNPVIFGFYGHLGGFAKVKRIAAAGRDSFPTSGLFRNCETNDEAVYALEVTGEDTGTLHHVKLTGDQAVGQDPDFFKKVFCINSNEQHWYSVSASDYTALSQLPVYRR